MRCKDHDQDVGLWVETFSGSSSSQTICDLDNRNDISHFVKIRNLNTYSLDTVDCKGNISSSTQPLFKFNSTKSSSIGSNWQDTLTNFAAKGQRTLSGVQLLSLQNGSGNDSISTEVEATSSLWGSQKVSITIIVTV